MPERPQAGAEFAEVVEAESEVMVGATIGNGAAKDAPPPPPAVGLNTVTWAVPTLRIFVAGTRVASWCVVLSNVVGRFTPFHCTSEHGRKFPPVTASVMPAVPAVALAGRTEEIAGTGSAEGVVTAKLKEVDVTDPVLTVTGCVPWKATSADVS